MSKANQTSSVSPHIFRQYDIRGIVGPDVDANVARDLGRAFGSILVRQFGGSPTIVVGRDNRLSSDELAEALIEGLLSTGCEVTSVGTVPTPALYFASAHRETDGAIQVTGSHNPPDYNGFKLSIRGSSIYGEAIQQIRQLIDDNEYETGQGTRTDRDILPSYIAYLTERFEVARPLKVVVDCGNGTGSVVAVDLLTALSPRLEIIPIFCESDGSFPNHHPDPVVDKNLIDLQNKVQEVGADLGIAFDGDADRIGAVDDKGVIVRGDTLTLLFALDLIERRGEGQRIVFDVKCSQALTEAIEAAGGVPIMSATGHSLIKQRMKDEGALIAGELSGHICFGDDYFGFDDALYGACLLVAIVAGDEISLHDRVGRLPTFVSTAEIRYPTTEDRKFDVVGDAVRHFSADYDVVDVDGARVLFGDGWGLIRASNTEPVLVARYEARSKEALSRIQQTMEDWLRTQNIDVS